MNEKAQEQGSLVAKLIRERAAKARQRKTGPPSPWRLFGTAIAWLKQMGPKVCREEPLYDCPICLDTGYFLTIRDGIAYANWPPCGSCEAGRRICRTGRWARDAKLDMPCDCRLCKAPGATAGRIPR